MIYIWTFIILLTAGLAYFVWGGREIARARFPKFFAWIEPLEIVGWKKSVTVLWARFKVVLGAILTLLTQMGQIDITPLLPVMSEKWQGIVQFAFNCIPLVISMSGIVEEKARRDTGTPLDIVALPEAAIAESPLLQKIVKDAEKVKTVSAPVAKLEAQIVEAKIKEAA